MTVLATLLGALPTLTVRIALSIIIGVVLLLDHERRYETASADELTRGLTALAYFAAAFVIVRALEEGRRALWGSWLKQKATREKERAQHAEDEARQLRYKAAIDEMAPYEWELLTDFLVNDHQRFYDSRLWTNPLMISLIQHGIVQHDTGGIGWFRIADHVWNDREILLSRFNDNR
jgi:ABC-type nickel/cobalt efflux system permease component RcnA